MTSTAGRVYASKTADERSRERRERLLEAGLDLFSSKGYGETTVQELCREASVSARTFYEEFANREELLVELHDRLNASALETVVAAVTALPVAQFEERATAGVRAYFEVMTADLRAARIALVESVGVNPGIDAHRRVAIGRFGELIEAQLRLTAEAGIIKERDFALTAVGLVGTLNELVTTFGARTDWPEMAEGVIAEGARFVVAAGTG